MSPRSLALSLAIALALTGMGGVSAWAGAGPGVDKGSADKASADKGRDSGNRDKDNTLPASVRRIERETGGKVLKAQPIQRDGREIYRVKIVTPQGRVRVVEDDVGPPPPQPPSDPLPPPDIRHRL